MTHRQTHDNYNSLNNAQGEFQPSKPRDQPMQSGGHAPGTLVGNDAAPEFSAKVLPAGSAPAESTFQPNPDVADQGHAPEQATTSASDTLMGATSGDVDQGFGKPLAGQTSDDLDGKVARGGGILGVGGTASDLNAADRDTRPEVRRGADRDDIKDRGDPGAPGVFSSKYAGAEERENEGATTVARESAS